MDNENWAMDNVQRKLKNKQWTMDNEQWKSQ